MLGSLHFVAFDFFFKAVILTSRTFLCRSPVSYTLLFSTIVIPRSSFSNILSTSPDTDNDNGSLFCFNCFLQVHNILQGESSINLNNASERVSTEVL